MKIDLQNQHLKDLSTPEIFDEVYSKRLWGRTGEFNSGSGTTNVNVETYINYVSSFIKLHSLASVVDLGCGDFKIGKQILEENPEVIYTGLDLVPSLIDYNNLYFSGGNITFSCIDAIKDPLPGADLCLIRQVFQHLSNEQIASILSKLDCYKYVVLTEHIPLGKYLLEINKDKNSGPDIRIYDGSGVFIEKPPFNIPSEVVLSYREDVGIIKAELRTYLIINQNKI